MVIYPHGLNRSMFVGDIALINITPAMAQRWLQSNLNRPFIRRKVNWLVEILQEGKWEVGGDAIAFLKTGELYNGQHRLMAIAESGISGRAYVKVNSTEGALFATDVGTKKTPMHFFHMFDLQPASAFSQVSKVIYYLSEENPDPYVACSSKRIGEKEHVEFGKQLVEQNIVPWLEHYLALWKRSKAKNICSHRILLGFGWMLYQVDKEKTTEFLTKTITGANVSSNEIEWILRNRLMSIEGSRIRDNYKKAQLICVAFEHKMNDRSVTQLRVTQNFPIIW